MEYILLTLFIFLTSISINSSAAPFEFHGYFRSGTGSNLKGGKQECFSNPGAQAEFRLGNECSIYGEATFALNFQESADAQPVFHAISTFAYSYDNKKDWETTSNNWVLRQAYLENEAFDEVPYSFWVGKRFYRWGDVHILDFFPMNFSGPGAGMEWKSAQGSNWKIGVIQNADSKEINGSDTAISTEIKDAAKTSFHLRIEEIPFQQDEKISFWFAGATTPATKATAAPYTDYKAGQGFAIAFKHWRPVVSGGNEFGLAYGNGVLSNLGPWGELMVDCNTDTDSACTVQSSNRLRFWNAFTKDWSKFSAQIAAAHDSYNKGTSSNSKVMWTSLGIQPIYYFTDRFQLTSVLGYSNVEDQSDNLGQRTLVRFTVGPQISFQKGYYARPVLRAFYTFNSWNKANTSSFSTTSAAGKENAHAVGVQGEVWF